MTHNNGVGMAVNGWGITITHNDDKTDYTVHITAPANTDIQLAWTETSTITATTTDEAQMNEANTIAKIIETTVADYINS